MQAPWQNQAEDLRLDLEDVLSHVNPRLQVICALRRERMGPSEIARTLGLARSTVWRHCARLRGLLRARGFEAYL